MKKTEDRKFGFVADMLLGKKLTPEQEKEKKAFEQEYDLAHEREKNHIWGL